MNSLVIILIAMVVLVAGYVFYGRWLAKKWGIDEKAKTPAFTHEDGDAFFGASLRWGALFILRFHIDVLDIWRSKCYG